MQELVLRIDQKVGAREDHAEEHRLDTRANAELDVLVNDAEEVDVKLGEPVLALGLSEALTYGDDALRDHG